MVARANGDVAYAGSESVNPNGRIWHARIAHQGSAVLKAYSKIFNLRDPPTDDEIDRMRRKDCDACLLGDMHAHPIHSKADEQYSATRTLGLVVADLMGPFSIIADGTRIRSKSLGGHYYILVVVDVYTHMVWVILLVKKSDASQRILSNYWPAFIYKQEKKWQYFVLTREENSLIPPWPHSSTLLALNTLGRNLASRATMG